MYYPRGASESFDTTKVIDWVTCSIRTTDTLDLEGKQKAVGGYIEYIELVQDGVHCGSMVVHEEGKWDKSLGVNEVAMALFRKLGMDTQLIVGNVVILASADGLVSEALHDITLAIWTWRQLRDGVITRDEWLALNIARENNMSEFCKKIEEMELKYNE